MRADKVRLAFAARRLLIECGRTGGDIRRGFLRFASRTINDTKVDRTNAASPNGSGASKHGA
jgi:hypothetical protein